MRTGKRNVEDREEEHREQERGKLRTGKRNTENREEER